jgi:hypothetical protein
MRLLAAREVSGGEAIARDLCLAMRTSGRGGGRHAVYRDVDGTNRIRIWREKGNDMDRLERRRCKYLTHPLAAAPYPAYRSPPPWPPIPSLCLAAHGTQTK